MNENKKINLFCHWFNDEIHLSSDILFKWRLFPPTLTLLLHFSHDSSTDSLVFVIPETVRLQEAAKSIFSSANEIILLWLSDFEDFVQHVLVFHNGSFLSKNLSDCRNAGGHYEAILPFVGWMLLGQSCFPVCNQLCVQQGPVGPRGPQGLQGKQVSASPQGIELARAEGRACGERGFCIPGAVSILRDLWLNAPSSRREFKQGLCSRWTLDTGIGSKRTVY